MPRFSRPNTIEKSNNNLVLKIHKLNPDLLQNSKISNDNDEEVYIGRGSFAVVQLQTYRGFAVKRLPNTVVADVRKEAQIPAQLCHPNLPYLFGVVTSKPLGQ